MLTTVDSAKKKWCPAARVMNREGSGGGNRWDGSVLEADAPSGSLCMGAACMAWRWAQRQRETRRLYHDDAGYTARMMDYRGSTDSEGWTYSHSDSDTTGRRFDLLHRLPPDGLEPVGYCGLAGIPPISGEL